jgi:hypothetical protein
VAKAKALQAKHEAVAERLRALGRLAVMRARHGPGAEGRSRIEFWIIGV